jgi:hypothetical protein
MQKGVLLICLLLLSACSSMPEAEKSAIAALEALPLVPRAPQEGDVLFAKLQKQDGTWQLLSIASKRMPVDLLKAEERVYIQPDKQLVMLDYDHHQYRDIPRRLLDCGPSISYNKHITYNPCFSLFSRNTKFGEGLFGWSRRLDIAELNTAIQQTDLLAQATQEMARVNEERQRCLVIRQQAKKVIANQKVILRVIDQTNMYARGHELVAYEYDVMSDIPAEGCEQDLARVMMNYSIGLHQDLDLVLELRGKTDTGKLENDTLTLHRAIAEADTQFIPTLYIIGKKIEQYNLDKTWSNGDVAIDWRTLEISDTDLRQSFDVRNLSSSSIKIQRVSFYINKHVVTKRNPYKLSAGASYKGQEHASRYFMLEPKVRQSVDAIKVINKKSEQAEFGIKVTYTINGENRTLFKTDTVTLSSIL